MAKRTKVALIYDFDGTLSTTDMQNYALIPEFGMEPDDFWYEANKWGRDHFADQVTGSMYYFVKKAEELSGCHIISHDLTFQGICHECLKLKKN